ncbi:MAG: hypothetical protein ACLP07_06520 [Terracidiphilus sp.]
MSRRRSSSFSVLTVVSELAEYTRALRKTALLNLRLHLVISWT